MVLEGEALSSSNPKAIMILSSVSLLMMTEEKDSMGGNLAPVGFSRVH